MLIEIETKNGALIDTFDVAGEAVPRAGEEIVLPLPHAGLQDATRLMVLEVVYRLEHSLLTPVVRCRPTRGQADSIESSRRELLEELGWFAPQRG